MNERPLWLAEPPFIVADRSTVPDPVQPFDLLHSGRSNLKLFGDYAELRQIRE